MSELAERDMCVQPKSIAKQSFPKLFNSLQNNNEVEGKYTCRLDCCCDGNETHMENFLFKQQRRREMKIKSHAKMKNE